MNARCVMRVRWRSFPDRSRKGRGGIKSRTALEGRVVKTVSAGDANRQFSALLREVRRDAEITVSRHGRPIAQISPVKSLRRDGEAARNRVLEPLEQQKVTARRSWSREALYD